MIDALLLIIRQLLHSGKSWTTSILKNGSSSWSLRPVRPERHWGALQSSIRGSRWLILMKVIPFFPTWSQFFPRYITVTVCLNMRQLAQNASLSKSPTPRGKTPPRDRSCHLRIFLNEIGPNQNMHLTWTNSMIFLLYNFYTDNSIFFPF